MKINVIFDTSAYRNLTLNSTISEIEEKLKKIRMAEAEKGINVHLSTIVLTELLNHLSKNEQNLKKRNDCLNGIIASIFHGRNQILEIDKYKPSLNNIVLQDVFGIIDEKEKIYNYSVLNICNEITTKIQKGKTIEQIQDDIEIGNAIEINHRNCIETRINEFEIFTKIIKGFNPDVNLEKSEIGNKEFYKSLTKGQGKEKKFAEIMAKTYVDGTIQFFKQYNLSVTQNHSEKFIRIYKPAIINMQDFFTKFGAGTNLSHHKRKIWNTINDTHLLMSSYIKDEKVILVTSDKKMKYEESDIFQKMELNAYLRYLDY